MLKIKIYIGTSPITSTASLRHLYCPSLPSENREHQTSIDANDPARYGDKTWKDDPIESARRIWEWWRAKKDDVRIRHLIVAARLVALVQVSSASVERVFSQVKLICETCGVSPLEETLETRLMERVNQYED